MPINNKNGKWYWGTQGPFNTKEKVYINSYSVFLSDKNIQHKIKTENPNASFFFTGDFNGHSQFWWTQQQKVGKLKIF